MVLHQPRGLSLSDNEDLRLLLRALSTRLAGYSLVTTVIQCSGFYRVDCNGSWIGGEVGVQEEGNWSTVSGILIPLCSVAVPRPWDLHCARRQQFKRIRCYLFYGSYVMPLIHCSHREHFYTMANLRHITGTEACHEYAKPRNNALILMMTAGPADKQHGRHLGHVRFRLSARIGW
ncbi:hypothetical protein PISMIDRAFT_292402 [Pisolithus microcarpus 441]|uniref:Uncharacterized protein n=1 Tax=Pisolithus microcarpus 441 TaxID=765257 RepID=A0A0C9Z6W4_9AGAM|nr:hypothetical protein PISMIDRAFT_292402 [Pisolithus microcarpus 441]